MTGTEYADILRDARLLSGGAPQYAWVRAWETAYGIPLCAAAEAAASAAGEEGLFAVWLHGLSRAVRGRYTIRVPDFARAADEAARDLRLSGAVLFPAVVRDAANAQTFASWSAACFSGMRGATVSQTDECVFLPWLCAMRARYVQE